MHQIRKHSYRALRKAVTNNPSYCLGVRISWPLPGVPGIRVSLARFSAFRTITLMRWASVWYCSRMNSWPKARGTHTELFLWPNVSWELTLWGSEGGEKPRDKDKCWRDLARGGKLSSFTQQMFPSSFGRLEIKWNLRKERNWENRADSNCKALQTRAHEYVSIVLSVNVSTNASILSESMFLIPFKMDLPWITACQSKGTGYWFQSESISLYLKDISKI